MDSMKKAREYLVEMGICAVDGSGDPNVEALFSRIEIVRKELEDLRREVANNQVVYGLSANYLISKMNLILHWL